MGDSRANRSSTNVDAPPPICARPPGFEHAADLREIASLVGNEVQHTVRNDDGDALIVGQRGCRVGVTQADVGKPAAGGSGRADRRDVERGPLLVFFATTALALACAGLPGTLSYIVGVHRSPALLSVWLNASEKARRAHQNRTSLRARQGQRTSVRLSHSCLTGNHRELAEVPNSLGLNGLGVV